MTRHASNAAQLGLQLEEVLARGVLIGGALLGRILGAFLLCVAYWHEWRKGGLLLVIQLWVRETLYHLHRYIKSVQPPSEDWISVRVKATRLAAGRYWRGRLARSARIQGYQRTWIARPEFQAAMKNVRLAPVRRESGR